MYKTLTILLENGEKHVINKLEIKGKEIIKQIEEEDE